MMGQTTVVPLGGLGEIGLNALALESDRDLLLLDCGLLFPQSQHPGIDYFVPDFSYLAQRREKFRGVILTHGHEDHVGAVPHLTREVSVPVIGTPMALGLLEGRSPEWARRSRNQLRSVAVGSTVDVGPFRVEFIRVNHSTPESCALGVETPGGTILHTGDFRFDPTPPDGKLADEAALARWGQRGVDLLCCDSTNAVREGVIPSERCVGETLRRLMPAVEGRAYVATFSSHIHRIQQVIEVSLGVGRRVALLGRSVTQAVRLARRLGHLKTAPGDLVPEPRSRGVARGALTVVLGGSQAEPGSALWRVAHGREPHHQILPGDHVFLSSRLIPGNETAIHRLTNRCIRLGATVHVGEEAGIHVSGHPSVADVARLLEHTRPSHLLPVHGELRHLDALARAAQGWGLPWGRVFRVENGQGLILEGGRLRLGPTVPTGRTYVDSGECGDTADSLLPQRRRLGEEGLAVVVAGFRTGSRRPAWGPRVLLRGVAPDRRAAEVAEEAEQAVRQHLIRCGEGPVRAGDLEQEMERALRRHFRRLEGRRPSIAAVAVTV